MEAIRRSLSLHRFGHIDLKVAALVEWVFYDSVATAKELAQRLAAIARQIEELIPNVYNAESKDGYLHQLFASFQKELLPNLKVSSSRNKCQHPTKLFAHYSCWRDSRSSAIASLAVCAFSLPALNSAREAAAS